MKCKQIFIHALFFFLIFIVTDILKSSVVYSANTFEDSRGRFSIDIPMGMKLEPQKDDTVYVFKDEDWTIIIQYFTDMNNRTSLHNKGIADMKESGLPGATLKGEIKNLIINEHKARWGTYKDIIPIGSMTIELYGLVGAVELKEGGVYFLSILNEASLKKFGKALEKSFQSIRDAGAPVSTVKNDTEIEKEEPGGSPVFEHKDLSLSLPQGWVSADIPPNVEKEVIGWLKSETIPGATITVMCHRGFGKNYSTVRIYGLSSISTAYPLGNKMLKKKKKIKTEKGNKAFVELWQGILDEGGRTVTMQSPMAVAKTKNCWLLMIGYSVDTYSPQLETDFMEILNSAQ